MATLWDPSLLSDPSDLTAITLLEGVDFYEYNDVEEVFEEWTCRDRTQLCMDSDSGDPSYALDC